MFNTLAIKLQDVKRLPAEEKDHVATELYSL